MMDVRFLAIGSDEREVPLIANGAETLVTADNFKQYIDLLRKVQCSGQIRSEFFQALSSTVLICACDSSWKTLFAA